MWETDRRPGESLNFDELIDELRELSKEMLRKLSTVEAIQVIGIDLLKRSKTSY